MKANERLIVVVAPDGKNYTFWVEPRPDNHIPYHALAVTNRTNSAATLATAIQSELPTL